MRARARIWQTLGRILPLLYLGLVYVLILGPMIVVVIAAFNSAPAFPSPFRSFTLKWFESLFNKREFIRAMWTSIRVGVGAAGMATLLGVPLSVLMVRREFRGKEILSAFFMSPLIIPQVALSIALLQMFSLLHIRLTEITLIFAHTVFIMPFVIRSATSSLQFVDPALEEAAMTLGANRLTTFFHITFPLIRAGVTAGFILAFVISFINVPLSLFLTTPGSATLPIRVFAYMESRLDPVVAAVGTLIILMVLLVSLFLEKVAKVRLIL